MGYCEVRFYSDKSNLTMRIFILFWNLIVFKNSGYWTPPSGSTVAAQFLLNQDTVSKLQEQCLLFMVYF